ncbi:hypothetical protein D3C80_1356880 [compost metagenome]
MLHPPVHSDLDGVVVGALDRPVEGGIDIATGLVGGAAVAGVVVGGHVVDDVLGGDLDRLLAGTDEVRRIVLAADQHPLDLVGARLVLRAHVRHVTLEHRLQGHIRLPLGLALGRRILAAGHLGEDVAGHRAGLLRGRIGGPAHVHLALGTIRVVGPVTDHVDLAAAGLDAQAEALQFGIPDKFVACCRRLGVVDQCLR